MKAISDIPVYRRIDSQSLGRLIVRLAIVAPALIDWLHGLLLEEAGIGVLASIYRLGLLLLGALFLLRRPSWTMLFVMLAYLLYIVTSYLTWSATTQLRIPEELLSSVNILFLPMCYMIFAYCTRHLGVTPEFIIRQIIVYGKITAIIVVVSLIFDIGIPTYSNAAGSVYGFGTQSYYIAGNVLGLTLVVSLAVALHVLLKRFTLRHLADVIIIFAGAFSVGSRTGMVVSALLLCLYLLYFVFLSSGQRTQRVLVGLAIVPVFVYGGLKTYELVSQYSRMISKAEAIIAGEIRSDHANPAWQYVTSKKAINQISGSSYDVHTREYALYSPKKDVLRATAESDPVDAIGAYGFIGMAVLYLPYALGLLWAIVRYFQTRQFVALVTVTGLILLSGHSTMAGHVLFSSKSTQFASVFIFLALGALHKLQRDPAPAAAAGR